MEKTSGSGFPCAASRVQELMGHKTITMTLRYSHLSPDHKRKAMEVLESQFSAKSPADFHDIPTFAPLSEVKKAV
jgi:hypothetical protein